VYKVDSRPASPESAETEALELGGQEAQERREELLRQQLRDMRTGDDAVAYFTRHGANTDVKLIHCVLASHISKSTEVLSPYDLLVIPEERIKRETEYFTITPSGVVHVMPGQLSECVSLSEWVHQCMMYRVLKSMAYFRLYVHRKAMLQWRQNARDASFCRKRARLARGCFWSRPLLMKPMFKVKALACEVGATSMLALPEKCVRLEEFEAAAQCLNPDTHGGKRQVLERTRDAVVETLEGLLAALREGSDQVNSRRSTSSFAKSRTRSLAKEKMETKERLRMEQILREDEVAVSSCVRLAEYMFQANVVQSITQTAEDLCTRVEGNGGEQKKKLFVLTARLGSRAGQVLLEPCSERFLKVFRDIHQDLIGLAESLPSLISARSVLAVHRRSISTSLGDLMANHRPWRFLTNSTMVKLKAQLQEAERMAVETYEPFRRIFEYKSSWNKDAFCKQSHSIQSLTREVDLMLQFQESLSKLRVQRQVGVLVLEGRQLRDELQPVPSTVLQSIWPLMQSRVRHEAARLAERLEKLNQELDERPKLPSIQAYSQMLEMAHAEEPSLEAAVDEIQGAHRLLRTHGVRFLSDDQVLLEQLLMHLHEFTSASLPAAKGFFAQQLREQRQRGSDEDLVASLEME